MLRLAALRQTARSALAVAALWLTITPVFAARQVLERLPALADNSVQYEVSLADCDNGSCPIEVRLMRAAKVLDSARAAWNAHAGPAVVAPSSTLFGAGEPIAPSDAPRVWSSGEEENTVTMAARSLILGNGQYALVLDQMAGFEHPKRRHVILAGRDGQLIALWSHTDAQGPSWSTVAVSPDAREAVYFSVFFSPAADAPDRAIGLRLAWDGAASQLVEHALRDLSAVLVGSYSTAAAAHAARAASPCLSDYWVLDSTSWITAGHKRFFLAGVATRATALDAEVIRLHACDPHIGASVVLLRRATTRR